MVHITVGIAQFFVIILTQMAIVMLSVLAAGLVIGTGVFLVWRRIARRRRMR